jgi:hypothetical protein
MIGCFSMGSNQARFICIACHRSLSAKPGACPRCHVDRLDLSRPDVRDEVRQHAEKMLYRRMMREELTFGGIGAGVAVVLGWVLYIAFYESWPDLRLPFFAGFVGGLALNRLLVRVYLRMRPDAGIAVYAARRTREKSEFDPEGDLDQLLRSLGATLDA